MSIQLERFESQWSGTIPDDWDFTRANRVATEHRETVSPAKLDFERVFHYSIPVIEETGDGQYENPADIKSTKLVLEGGEVLVSKLNPRKSRVLLASNHQPLSVASGEFIPLSPNTDLVLPRYLETVFLSEPARQYLDGIATSATKSHQRVSPREIREFRFPRPPVEEQRRLVSFLDHRTARIDALVAKQKRILKFLEEKRQAVLDRLLEQAETEGNARLKYLVDFLPGFAFSSDDFSKNPDDVRLLRGINVGIGEIDWDDVEYWPKEKVRDYERYLLEPGDIVLGMDRPWINDGIRIAQMSESDCPSLLVQRVLRIRAKSEVHQMYVRMVLESERFRQYFEPITTGVSVPHISQKQVGEFRIPLPSKSHQASILSQWETFQGEKHQLEQSIKKSINLLEEKRQALITAAVTGQIDVTEERDVIQDHSV